MHPDWAAIEKLLPKDQDPESQPVSVVEDYKVVNIKTFLAIRSTPVATTDNSNKIGELYNGAVVSVFEIKGNWARIGGEAWCSLTYLKKI